MLRCVALLRTDVSEERIASIIKLTRIGELWTTLTVISNRSTLRRSASFQVTDDVVPSSPIFVTLMMKVIRFFEMSVLKRLTRRKIPRRRHSLYSPPCKPQILRSINRLDSVAETYFLLDMNWVFISQKTAFFIVTAVKTSNLTKQDTVFKHIIGCPLWEGISSVACRLMIVRAVIVSLALNFL
jgi:hypothetical protein